MKPAFVEPYKHDRETKAQHAERVEFLRKLWEELKPGDTLHTILRHVSGSGMYRAIDVFHITCDKDGLHRAWLSYWIAKALGDKFDERYDAIGVGGAGMDMGFHIVYNLSSVLYPKGFRCSGKECPSNDHSNGRARPHRFPTEWARNPVDQNGVCPIWDAREQRGQICGLTAAQHPTRSQHHRDGGFALIHRWL